MTTAIKPVIPGLLLDADTVHAAMRQWLSDTYGWEMKEDASDPAYRLTRMWAWREQLMRQAVYDSALATILPWAVGAWLDEIGVTYYRLPRLPAEDDDTYRARLRAAIELYAVGLSAGWYEQTARRIAGVRDARFRSPTPGIGRIAILADEGLRTDTNAIRYPNGIPDTALLDAVTAAVTADAAEQQTDQITVVACTRQRFDVSATVTVDGAVPEATGIIGRARAQLDQVVAAASVIGRGLTTAQVAGAVVIPRGRHRRRHRDRDRRRRRYARRRHLDCRGRGGGAPAPDNHGGAGLTMARPPNRASGLERMLDAAQAARVAGIDTEMPALTHRGVRLPRGAAGAARMGPRSHGLRPQRPRGFQAAPSGRRVRAGAAAGHPGGDSTCT